MGKDFQKIDVDVKDNRRETVEESKRKYQELITRLFKLFPLRFKQAVRPGVPVAQYYGPEQGMLSGKPSDEQLGEYVMNLARYSKDIYEHAETDENINKKECSTINVHLCKLVIDKYHDEEHKKPTGTMFLDVDVYETDPDSAGKKTLTIAFEGTNDKFDGWTDADVSRTCVEDEESGIFAMYAESLLTKQVVKIYENDTRTVNECRSVPEEPTPIKPYKSKDQHSLYLSSCAMGLCSHTKLHRGFLKQYLLLRNQVIKKIKDQLALNNNDGKSLKVHITGHSLGGALATICAVDVSEQFSVKCPELQVTCVTFGSPRPGNSAFAKRYKKFVKRNQENGADESYRIVEQADVVPRFPTAIRYTHVCSGHYIGEGGMWEEVAPLTHFVFGQGTYHKMNTYIQNLEDSKQQQQQQQQQQ